jgi:putative glycosyltransferase (TIGR04348 family)
VAQNYNQQRHQILIALHARRSHASIRLFRQMNPHSRVILALTGTDVYRDIHRNHEARRSLAMADRLIALQPRAADELPVQFRSKCRVIYQSARPIRSARPGHKNFQVAVVGHLRAVKDPFRTALALRFLPKDSRIRVVHVGQALDPKMASRAGLFSKLDHRYLWTGELPRWRARQILASSKLLVLSSLMEGGANVISEALVSDVPVLASRIPGSVGLLGEDYPGYFPIRRTRALAGLMTRAERDPGFYAKLKTSCRKLKPLFDPERERAGWKRLMNEL